MKELTINTLQSNVLMLFSGAIDGLKKANGRDYDSQ